MHRLIIAAAMAFSPAMASADHNHGNQSQRGHVHDATPTMLTASTPSDGAVLAEAPQVLALMFAHPVTLQAVSITGPAGPVNTSFRPPSEIAASYTIPLPSGLAAGNYEARWSASSDGHEMSGVIRFIVQ
jgi:methionine-rich copper-binding protein CopC